MAETPHNSEQPFAQAPAKPVRTRGDRMFDRWVYAGLNGVGTFILTIPLAYWGDRAIHKASGKTYFERGAEELTKLGVKDGYEVMKTTTLGIGGTVMVLPVYFAEHYRKPIVEWFNKHYGSEKDKTTKVEVPSPQTFTTLLKGRVVAWLAVFSGFKLAIWGSKAAGNPQMLDNFETAVGEKVAHVLKQPLHDPLKLKNFEKEINVAKQEIGAAKLANTETKELEKNLKKLIEKCETKTYSYGKLGALDVFATTAATSILYVTSRIFAKRKAAKEQGARVSIKAAPETTQSAVTQKMDVVADNAGPGKTIASTTHAGVVAQDTALQAQL